MHTEVQGALPAGEKAYFRIGEVSRLTATKPFVLRYWESEFPTLQPVKNPAGHRLYRREDVEMVFEIKRLLYDEGFTIAGARKHLIEQNGGEAQAASAEPKPARQTRAAEAQSRAHRKALLDLREELLAILTLLERE